MREHPSLNTTEPVLLSVGAVADRLGIAPETLRSWGRRYGLAPADRTSGGHRRFTLSELATLTQMQRLITTGVKPAEAARQALTQPGSASLDPEPGRSAAATADRTTGSADRHTLDSPAEARRLARLAAALDVDAVGERLSVLLATVGVTRTWQHVCLPVLTALGEQWASTGRTIDVEHALTQAIVHAMWDHRQAQPAPRANRPVLLACVSSDKHSLTLHVVAAALAELQVATKTLGAEVPAHALAAAAHRTKAGAVFVWRQMPGPMTDEDDWSRLTDRLGADPNLTLVAGGLGWQDQPLPTLVHRVRDLWSALDLLTPPSI